MPRGPTPGDAGRLAEEAGTLGSSRETALMEATALLTQDRRC